MKPAMQQLQKVASNIALAIAWVGFMVAVPVAFIAPVLFVIMFSVLVIKFAVWFFCVL